MKVTVVKSYHNHKLYTVELKQGVQSFRLDITRPLTEARWFARMFRVALKKSHTDSTK